VRITKHKKKKMKTRAAVVEDLTSVLAMIEKLEQSGCKYLAVGTHPMNSGAQQFYMKNGFEERTGRGPRFRINLHRD
jgi:GNAT superfamily N-acetyltransferase